MMRMDKRLVSMSVLLVLVLVSTIIFMGCGQEKDNNAAEDASLPVVTVGCDDYSPFSYTDDDGNITGIDVELAREAFSRIGYRPHFVFINWEDKNQLLQDGDIDCIWSSFTLTGRESQYAWAGPYMKSNQVVAVRENSDIYTMDDLAGKILAVQSTTKPEDIIRKHDGTVPQLQKVLSVQKRDLVFLLMAKGYADAMAAHDTSIEQCMKNTGLKVRILDTPLKSVGLGVAFDKNDTRGINQKLNGALAEMYQDGTMQEILGRYFANPEKFLEVPHEGD